ncbi:TPA: type 1 fimbrial protein [Klebsiella quasipneumoniae]|uniref:fimbrial protein n=1 Tax=Klebsiella quasipneumoniae TaxID=1463165 RepID=UPI0021D8345A|nr:fimbrial protein [Klebsiella quasipneumoniae]MCU8746819.1 type 1 fimbrial protein [Klebsiella quasipneumoniae]HBV2213446.1 type 1 fimbrial protein [Klebsiella quasipneumoniae]HCT3770400.1 type 1 fimbrial protein [Klebsiella quasipneumoniae]
MKLISLCLATLVAGLVAGPVGAADGTLNFIGKVVNGACKLEGAGDNGVINVSMGDIPLSRLKNSQSGTGPAVGVDIRVKDCEKGTYYIVVDGPTPAGMPEHRVLALDGRGKPAGNVGILLTDRTGTPLSLDERIDPQHDPRIEIPADGGSGTFRLKAFYYTWDKAHMDPGDGNATARFTIMQE